MDSLQEYLRLKTILFELYKRQGQDTWRIIEQVVEDLKEVDQGMAQAKLLARKAIK